MKVVFRWGLWLALSFAVILVLTKAPHLPKTLWYNFPDIDDYQIFDNDTIAGSTPFSPIPLQEKMAWPDGEGVDYLKKYQTEAFLVARHDTLQVEWLGNAEEKGKLLGSFSMAKTIVSLLFWNLKETGVLLSWDQPVYSFFPQWAESKNDSLLTVHHLISMTANLNWDESYDLPLSMTTRAYYGSDLSGMINEFHTKGTPGKKVLYQSSNQIFLAAIYRKLTGISMAKGMEKFIWKPMGAEHFALWSIEHPHGLEKAFCCISSTAHDFLRLGLVCLGKGSWHKKKLWNENSIQESWKAVNALSEEDDSPNVDYGMGWWITQYMYAGKKYPVYYMRGIKGQYILIVPDAEMVIVRLGHQRDQTLIGQHRADIYQYLKMGFELTQ